MAFVEDIRLKGVPLSSGITWGRVFFLSKPKVAKKKPILKKNEIDREILRYRFALTRSQKDVQELQKSCDDKKPSLVRKVLQAHCELLSDPAIVEMVEKKIRSLKQRTEIALESVTEEYQNRFHKIKDPFFQQRIQDVTDVSERILKNLQIFSEKKKKLKKVILCAEEIFPSDAMEKEGCEVLAFVTRRGGYNSHAAIIARSRCLPYISDIDLTNAQHQEIVGMLVDGFDGEVVLNPSKKTLQLYEKKIKILEEEKKKKERFDPPCQMLNGRKIECYVNIETERDIDKVLKQKIAGVGIFRTEFLFLSEKGVPCVGRQTQIYKKLAQKLTPLPLVIRLFDVGADKCDLFSGRERSLLGERLSPEIPCSLSSSGVRFLLKHPKILEDQLLAIIEASSVGNVHLLLPFVSDVEEVLEIKRRIEEIKKRSSSQVKKHKLVLGSMIEVPAAALMADRLVQEVDFLSIGTNDLVQYLLGLDRTQTPAFSKEIPPSLLRLLQMIVGVAKEAKKPVILCGEMAATAEFLPIFLGIGIERFSLSTSHLAAFKEKIQALNQEEIEKKTKEALSSL